jgi:polyhydroxyalkanoate synthesis regulator phasin
LGHQLSDVFDDVSGGKMSKDEVEEVVSDLRTLLKTSSSKDKVLAASLLESAVVLILAVV